MTYKEALTYGTEQLKQAGIEEASLDAWLLLSHCIGMSRSGYFLHDGEVMAEEQEQTYRSDIEKRSRRIPLQHITGVQEFMGLEFSVNENVLIPRQDTECLVEEAIERLHSNMRILDMCTGSGCIIISLADAAKQRGLTDVVCVGADVSEAALAVSRENTKKLQADVTFVQSDLFTNVDGKFDILISNPPYIRTEVIEGLQEEVKLYDPYIALDGKEDGLYFYRRIVEEGRTFLNPGGRVMFEIGHDQGKDVSALMHAAGFTEIVVKKDLAGLDRVVIGVYN